MNEINFQDNPKFTAYVLGELSQTEREQVEALLRDNEDARRAVEEIRATAGLLSMELKVQPSDASLTDAQRQAIAQTRPRRSARSRFAIIVASGVAAAAIIAVGFSVSLPSLNRAREVARVDRSTSQGAGAKPEIAQSTVPAHQPPDELKLRAMRQGNANNHDEDGQGIRYGDGKVEFQKNPFAEKKSDNRYDIPSPSVSSNQAAKPFDENDSVLLPADGRDAPGTVANAPAPAISALSNQRMAHGSMEGGPSPRSANGSQDEVSKFIPFSPARGDGQRISGERLEPDSGHNTEAYDRITDNAFLAVAQNPLSTFSIDVDTASYSNVRRFINDMSQLPPKDAVRIEEMINYFPYAYPAPVGDAPFGAGIEVAACPWNSEHRLVRIALKGKEIAKEERPASNLVFLIDVSGSMEPANKLPLLKNSMQRMVRELNAKDRVAIVVYAGNSGLVLPSTACDEAHRQTILDALDRLQAGGSTNGASGIELAYQVANENFIKGATNRVILCTDGDFNVGVTNQGDLTRLIEDKAKSNVFLSVLGFGMGNVKDSTMEKLADKGNGNYAYIDTPREANKVLVEQMAGTLITIAKDVKIQVEFNPAKVGSYRLIGYENRMLAKEDFNDDKKDAGEIGAGHTVTAMYEIAPVGAKGDAPAVDPLKYQDNPASKPGAAELLTVKLRYKAPDAAIEQGTSKLLEFPVKDDGERFEKASKDFKFVAAVAGFGMVLRDSQYKGNLNLDAVMELAQDGRGEDVGGYRSEFIELVRKAKTIHSR